jgi:hypothetical protein
VSKEQTPSNLVIKAVKEVVDIFGPFKYFECQNWLSLKCSIEVAILEEIDWESFLINGVLLDPNSSMTLVNRSICPINYGVWN